MRRPAIAAAALLALAGCGGGGGAKDDVAQAIHELQSAARAGDVRKICTELFTSRLVAGIAKATRGKSCDVQVRGQLARKDETITVRSVTVTGNSAVAVVREQNRNVSRLTLVKAGGRWRIDAIAAAR